MHDHDLDLIASLADDSASDEAGHAAELIETCPICRAEFQMQQKTRAGLRALPAVTLSDTERAMLHRRISAAIVTEGRRPAASRRSWLRLAPAAAALALVVGVAAVLTSQENHTTTEGASAAFDLGTEAAAPRLATQGQTTLTTAAPATGADAGAKLEALHGLPDLGVVDLEELARRLPSEGVEPSDLESSPSCLSEASGTVLRVATATVAGKDVVAFLVGGAPETVEIYARQDCALVTRATLP